MGEFEAVADAVTGGMLGRAVEPASGQRAGRTNEAHCLNCGTALIGQYCHGCGQRAHVYRTLGAFGLDFLTGALNFEGKIFKTLPMLAWRPGDLTRRYIEGQRARFVSPLALFLFTVFLLFATIQLASGPNGLENVAVNDKVYRSTDEAIAGIRGKITILNEQRARAPVAARPALDKEIADQKEALDTVTQFSKEGVTKTILASKKTQVNSDIPLLNNAINRAKANPQLAIYKLQDAASKYAWLLIPISVPFLWLLFPFSRRFRLYDHSVFVTYSISFMMLLAVILTGWSKTGVPGAAAAALFVPPLHMYRQLKGAYGLSRVGAQWRSVLLVSFAVTALTLFAVAVVLLGISD
jgi:hypothetical protein